MTITGANFTGLNAVKFPNNVTATFTVVNDTTITTTVPAGAVAGPILLSKTSCPDAQTAVFTVNSCPTIALAPATLPNGAVGAAYNQSVMASPSGSYTYAVTAGALPAGLSLNSATGAITGTPTTSGASNFTITATSAAGCTGSQAYTINIQSTPRIVRIAPSGGAPGGPVSVPIELVSQGDENSAGLSVSFDPAVLSNPQAALGRDATGAQFNTNSNQASQGRFGLTLSLPANQRFTAGIRQLAVLTFNIAANTSVPSTMVNFGDQPVTREISDANANPLPASYTVGAVTITSGYEADVAPRPNGNNNGQVTITDAVQVGRFVAGLESPDAGSEFQRADCAPRDTLGDGRMSIVDWAQANRYAAGLDQVAPAGGPTAPAASGLLATQSSNTHSVALSGHIKRAVRITPAPQWVNGERFVTVDLDAVGEEYALGFSLLFNPSEWRFVSAAIGRDAQEAALHVSERDAARGRLGFALSLPAGRSFNPGERQLVVLRFAPRSATQETHFALSFSDAPVTREIADTEARALAASFEIKAGALTLANVSAASFSNGPIAREQIVAAFGANLAVSTESATTLPLPTELSGARALITDSRGAKRDAPSSAARAQRYCTPELRARWPEWIKSICSFRTVWLG